MPKTTPRVPLCDGVGAGYGVVGSALLLTIKGGEIVDASAQRIAHPGEVVGPSTPDQYPIKLSDPKAAARYSGRNSRLAILFNFSNMPAS